MKSPDRRLSLPRCGRALHRIPAHHRLRVLTHHPIPKELVQSIYDNWYRFFMSERSRISCSIARPRTAISRPRCPRWPKGHSQKDIKEYFHIYPWGQMPAELKEQAMEYYRLANDLAAELLGWVEQHTRATSLPTTAARSPP